MNPCSFPRCGCAIPATCTPAAPRKRKINRQDLDESNVALYDQIEALKQRQEATAWPFPPPGGPVPVKTKPEPPYRHEEEALL